jgi:adenosylcobinamide-phosphate synthase
MTDGAPLAALALDAALGWPGWLHSRLGHPVGLFAAIIDRCARRWNRPERSGAGRRWRGAWTMAIVAGGAFVAAWALETALRGWLGPAAWPVIALLAWPGLAQRSLDDHYRPIATALEAGDQAAARQAVGMIVGRDTGALDAAGVARAAIESLAESFCDAVVAPLFWFAILGLPGLWAYKAINTADSLIGHKEEPFGDFGMAAARIDDAMNLIPARLSAILICLAGGGGWRVLWRDHGNHASPNAGWPEAAMAGALGVRIAGPARYDGVMLDKLWIGSGAEPGLRAMARARRVYHRSCGLLWIGTGVAAWAL